MNKAKGPTPTALKREIMLLRDENARLKERVELHRLKEMKLLSEIIELKNKHADHD